MYYEIMGARAGPEGALPRLSSGVQVAATAPRPPFELEPRLRLVEASSAAARANVLAARTEPASVDAAEEAALLARAQRLLWQVLKRRN